MASSIYRVSTRSKAKLSYQPGPLWPKTVYSCLLVFGIILGPFWHALRLFPYVPLSPIAEMSQKGSKRAPKPPQRVPGGTNKGQKGSFYLKCAPKAPKRHPKRSPIAPIWGHWKPLEASLEALGAPFGHFSSQRAQFWAPRSRFRSLFGRFCGPCCIGVVEIDRQGTLSLGISC